MTARDTVPTRSLLHRAQRAVTTPEGLLRTSLGLVYLWFGALKAVEAAPVLDLLRAASPTLATVPPLEGEFVLKNLVLLAAAASLFLGVRNAPKGPRDVG